MRVSINEFEAALEAVAGWNDNAEVFIEVEGRSFRIGDIEDNHGRIVIHADAPGHRFQGVDFLLNRQAPQTGPVDQPDGFAACCDDTTAPTEYRDCSTNGPMIVD